MRRFATGAAIGLALLFLGAQAVEYGREHSNPAERTEPAWDRTRTRALAARACFDCHSNETAWPWYARLAPASWLVQRDVNEGRRKLNFSEWRRVQKESRESAETVRTGEMPPRLYALMHPAARLSPAERRVLADGFEATFGGEGARRRAGSDGHRAGYR